MEGLPRPGWFLSPCGYTETGNEGKPGKKENPDLPVASSYLGREWTALSQPHQLTVPCTGIRTYSTIHNTRSRGNHSFFKLHPLKMQREDCLFDEMVKREEGPRWDLGRLQDALGVLPAITPS